MRGELEIRREYLKRHGDQIVAQDDNVAVVKTARSA
jgi:urease accessory protein UreE